jgi:hypothetical protein
MLLFVSTTCVDKNDTITLYQEEVQSMSLYQLIIRISSPTYSDKIATSLLSKSLKTRCYYRIEPSSCIHCHTDSTL